MRFGRRKSHAESDRPRNCPYVRRHDPPRFSAGRLPRAPSASSLADLLALKAQGAVAKEHDERSVIMIFNLGAPSQLDTWDMKPDAPAEIRGPFKPIKTNAPGIEISEIFPRTPSRPTSFRSCAAAITRPPRCTTPATR